MSGQSAEFMRSICRKGGEATKAKYANTPYFKEITAKGGRASKNVRRTRREKRIIPNRKPDPAKPMLDSLDAILTELNR